MGDPPAMDPAHVLVPAAPWFFPTMSDPYPSPVSDAFHLPGPARRRQDAYSMSSPYAPYALPRHRSRPRSVSAANPPRGPSPSLSTVSSGSHHRAPAAPHTLFASDSPPSMFPHTPPPPKHTKHRLTDVDRMKICVYHLEHPHARQEDIATQFSVERSTISKILKDKDRWLQIDPDDHNDHSSRHRGSKFPIIEHFLRKDLQIWSEQGTIITDQLLRERALQIGQEKDSSAERFKASSGWIENFKARHHIRRGQWSDAVLFGPLSRGGIGPLLRPLESRDQGVGMDMNYGLVHAQSHHQHPQQQHWGTPPNSPPDSQDSSPVLPPSSAQSGLVLDSTLHAQQGQGGAHHSQSASPDMGSATAPPSTAVGAQTPVLTQLALDPSAIQHSPEGYDAHTHPHTLHNEYTMHHMDLQQQPQQDQVQQAYDTGTVEEMPLEVQIGEGPPPSLEQAENAMNIVLRWLDSVAPPDFILHDERLALTHVKCAMFNHASGMPYTRT